MASILVQYNIKKNIIFHISLIVYSPSILPAVDVIKKGYSLWQGSLPKRCVDRYREEPWRCYFGYRIYPTLRGILNKIQTNY